MQIHFSNDEIQNIESGLVVVLAYDKESPSGGAPAGLAKALNEQNAGWLQEIIDGKEFTGKLLEMSVLHRPAGLKAKRLLVAGAGNSDKFNADALRKIAGAVVRAWKPKGALSIALALDGEVGKPELVAAAVEGAMLGDFEPNRLKTEAKETLESFTVVVPGGDEALRAAAERGRILAEAQNFTRELVNEPANLLTPAALAARARDMAAEWKLGCDVITLERMRELGMGALVGVAQGSAEPPALIVIRYEPAAKPEPPDHLALVGKGVTFDTGGISIKPSEGMEKMKYDMAGGAAAIGAMQAIAQLKPRIPVTAFIPAVENMPGSRAQRPGDIVTSLSGKTIEVLNTDAEGRLILADAITYARQQGCTHMVDAATLTGAIVVALGHVHVGAFTNNDAMLNRVMSAAREEGENLWHMPLDEEYKEYLKSVFADLPNIGGRWGGAITAAMFLKEFADSTPWVHLDIAGTAWLDDCKPYLAKGPSGVGVRTFVTLATSW